MYEYLKALFGTLEDGKPEALTFEQLVAKIEAADGLKLANLADGGYVSKAKFDAKELELSGVKDQLSQANTEIKSYQDMDIDGIKKAAADWEQKYNDDTKKLQDQLDAKQLEMDAMQFLSRFEFRDELARESVFARFMAKKLPRGDDGAFLGGEEYMKEMQDKYPDSFKKSEPAPAPAPEEEPAPAPDKPPMFAPNQPPAPDKPRRTLSELMKYKNEHPDAKISYD